jgi:hypothetical protein
VAARRIASARAGSFSVFFSVFIGLPQIDPEDGGYGSMTQVAVRRFLM